MIVGRQSGLPLGMPSNGIPFFDSWGWRHRKLVVVGGLGTLAALAVAAVTAILK